MTRGTVRSVRLDLLGAVLAGGRSRRYGSDKAFARVGGVSLVQRAAASLGGSVARIGLVSDDVARYAAAGFSVRPDLIPGIGSLGGLHTAIVWAAEEGLDGALVLACDMPFVPPLLLFELAGRLRRDSAVVPASRGPRGFEPLCAAYGVDCLAAVRRAIDRGDRAVNSFFDEVRLEVVELPVVESFGDPDRLFFNVNRVEDRARAEALLTEEGSDPHHPATE